MAIFKNFKISISGWSPHWRLTVRGKTTGNHVSGHGTQLVTPGIDLESSVTYKYITRL